MSERGDIVWGKLGTFPWWPAIVINPEDCGRDKVEKNKLWLFWFGDHKVAQVGYTKIFDFQKHFSEKCPAKVEKVLKTAMNEVLAILATRLNVDITDPSSLFEWAKKGFNSKACLRTNHTLVLPDIVKNALQKKAFKRKLKCCSEENGEDESGNALDDVSNGDLTLEDICIMCLKPNKTIILAHPFFVGGVCEECKVYINRIMESPKGGMDEICILCGQRGLLVYCSNSSCLSSLCDVCIKYMTPKGTYTKILKDDNWMCYLCKQNDDDDDCFIKKRKDCTTLGSPCTSAEKTPIRVLALNDAVMSYLVENRIKIDAYLIHPFSYMLPSPFNKSYDDFCPKEIRDISPNFIYGSFFVESTAVNREENQELFYASFYKFLFRLTASRATLHVFFMFVCDAEILDLFIMQRIKRFLKVNPTEIDIEMKKLYLWTNLPVMKHNKDKYKLKRQRSSISVEENTLSSFLKPLKDLFALE